MNFKIAALAVIIRADEQTIIEGARIFGYRRVGPLLCLSGVITPEFVSEIQRLQRMRDAANARRARRGSTT